MRRDAGICSLRVHFICVFLPFLFFFVGADFNVLFLRQFSSDFCYFRFILKRNDFATNLRRQISFFFIFKMYLLSFLFVHFQEKWEKTGKMYNSDVLFVWKHKWTQCSRNFSCTCVSYVLRLKPKKSVKNWWRNNTSKFGLKTQKNVNNFQNTWNFENSI